MPALSPRSTRRSLDPLGHEGFGHQLDVGVTRAAVATEVLGSQEAEIDLVGNLYLRILDRPGDSDGSAYFLAVLQNGATTPEVAAQLMGSEEFLALALCHSRTYPPSSELKVNRPEWHTGAPG